MKIARLKLLSVAMIACAAAIPATAFAVDGTINFTGSITASTCTVTTPPTVTLPSVAATSLGDTGSLAGNTPFNIALTACTAGIGGSGNLDQTVGVYFEPGSTVGTDGNLILNGGSTATGVEIQLTNSDGSIINLNGSAQTQNAKAVTLPADNGTATLAFGARYFATGTVPVGAGTANSSVTFTLVYQ